MILRYRETVFEVEVAKTGWEPKMLPMRATVGAGTD